MGHFSQRTVRSPRTNASRHEIRGEAREKRLGLIRAFARDEEVDAIVLYYANCADGSYQSLHKVHLRPLRELATDLGSWRAEPASDAGSHEKKRRHSAMAISTAAPHWNRTTLDAADVAAALLDRARALSTVLSLVATSSQHVAHAAAIIVEAIATGHLVMVCGNGGSAAEAQHLAGELVGRFRRDREPWPVLALTTDAAVLTAVANDYGYDTVFARQVAAFGHRGDVLVGISTSGESPNVVNAACQARDRGVSVIALTGREPTRLGLFSDVAIAVPATETPLVQEVHSVLVHLISEIVESSLVQQTIERTRVDEASALP
jgi:D-sedoheptulose 7-phosphate isomerase